jgi:molecular chaperone HscB
MTAADPTRNYFTLFDLPETFNVDPAALADKYRNLQQAVHPDRFATGTDQERRLSMQQSALINEAYRTLKQPLSRARYLLSLLGMDMEAEEKKPMDGEFLMQQMELRESLEAIKTAEQLLEFESQLSQLTDSLIRDIGQLFAGAVQENIDTLDKISDYVRRLQFLTKLEDEAQALEEQLQ